MCLTGTEDNKLVSKRWYVQTLKVSDILRNVYTLAELNSISN